MNEVIRVENLTYFYPEQNEYALSGVNLVIEPGEFVLLLGSSGVGKSTLLRSLNGLVPHFYGGRISGSVLVLGKDTISSEVNEISRHVGMVFQDPENQLITENPIREIAFGLENIGLPRLQMKKRVEEVTVTLRLADLREKKTSELSGGEKQKIALASVLVMHPQVLALDEPTSQLDPISADEFLAILKSLNEDLGISVVISEHRVERCFQFADRIIFLEKGKVVFDGKPSGFAKLFSNTSDAPLPPVTRVFASLGNGVMPLTVKDGRKVLMDICESSSGNKIERDSTTRKAQPWSGRDNATRILEASGLWKIYGDGTEALKGIDLEISEGESLAIIGENGSGKTTLVKHFNGLLKPTKGKVMLRGIDTSKQEVKRLSKICGMLGQNPSAQLMFDTTEEELEQTLKAMEVPRERWSELICKVLDILGIENLRNANPIELSCGERERIALATVLVYEPPLLVLDEPTRGIDSETKGKLSSYLNAYNASGNTVIVVTHDLEFASMFSRRVVLLAGGEIIADGEKHEVLSDSLFFTTQVNRCFRGISNDVVTVEEALEFVRSLQ
ncbi:MAG: ATP-binding cassette domain-containing protein [Actinomycetota bacterium]|nr:ATP-binding cassette domain-containing protein [Actinomycetota bacterium]